MANEEQLRQALPLVQVWVGGNWQSPWGRTLSVLPSIRDLVDIGLPDLQGFAECPGGGIEELLLRDAGKSFGVVHCHFRRAMAHIVLDDVYGHSSVEKGHGSGVTQSVRRGEGEFVPVFVGEPGDRV